jgi:hypothetical protein
VEERRDAGYVRDRMVEAKACEAVMEAMRARPAEELLQVWYHGR